MMKTNKSEHEEEDDQRGTAMKIIMMTGECCES